MPTHPEPAFSQLVIFASQQWLDPSGLKDGATLDPKKHWGTPVAGARTVCIDHPKDHALSRAKAGGYRNM
jgi:hypothetical protein